MGHGVSKWLRKPIPMSEMQNNPSFVGAFTHSVDGKGRVTIPAQWRLKGTGEMYMGLPYPDGSIQVLPPWVAWQKQQELSKVNISDTVGNRALMGVFSAADQFQCDKQGRIVLPERLRKHAGIKGKAVLAGALINFLIWNPGRYEVYREKEATSVYTTLGELENRWPKTE